jgi:hypothetical protein
VRAAHRYDPDANPTYCEYARPSGTGKFSTEEQHVGPKQYRLTKYGPQTILPNAVASVVEGDFEWDSDKAQSNLEEHGVSFPEAATVFADPAAVYLDDGSGT